MVLKLLIVLPMLLMAGCSSRNQADTEFEEYRQSRDERVAVSELVSEKREAYTEPLGEITFTGKPDDFSNVLLEVRSNAVELGLPRYYEFIEQDDHLELNVRIIEGTVGEPDSIIDVEESLIVDDIEFEDGTYTIHAEEYTFDLHMYEESVKRLKDDGGTLLHPTHYIPEEMTKRWYDEAREEVRN